MASKLADFLKTQKDPCYKTTVKKSRKGKEESQKNRTLRVTRRMKMQRLCFLLILQAKNLLEKTKNTLTTKQL